MSDVDDVLGEFLGDDEPNGSEKKKEKQRGVRLTERDQRMLVWLSEVGVADVEAVRRGLEALSEAEIGNANVQTERLAYRWTARMKQAGAVAAETPFYGQGQIAWVTREAGGPGKPKNLLGATVRHDLRVALVSTMFVDSRVTRWSADHRDDAKHRVDGLAISSHETVAVEVELTAKSAKRLDEIMRGLYMDMRNGVYDRVEYYATESAGKAVLKARERAARALDPRMTELVRVGFAFDDRAELRDDFDDDGEAILEEDRREVWQ